MKRILSTRWFFVAAVAASCLCTWTGLLWLEGMCTTGAGTNHFALSRARVHAVLFILYAAIAVAWWRYHASFKRRGSEPVELSLGRRVRVILAALTIAALVWVPWTHRLYRPWSAAVLPSEAKAMAAHHLNLWSDASARATEIATAHANNPEWDLMGRLYTVLALSNLALIEPESKPEYLLAVDNIIGDTLRLERTKGREHFLLSYAHYKPFVHQPARSIFVDGEIALMLASRCMVEEHADFGAELRKRVTDMVERMKLSPVLCAESYPDECWLFCNTVALAAVKLSDRLNHTDHSEFIEKWLRSAKKSLVDPETGLLISSFNLQGKPKDGPEGSSIWMAAHCLQLVDEAFAARQYEKARYYLGDEILGFGYAKEWPHREAGRHDLDSGPVVPILDASPGSSGLALVGAAAFSDHAYYAKLLASLRFGAFPIAEDGALRFAASNQVGDAVMLYSMVVGPLWKKAKETPEP